MTGSLIQPRVQVFWGSLNLTSYSGSGGFPQGQPLVYDVEAQIEGETSAPTGSMKWDPTGPGYAIYEQLISDATYMSTPITTDFFFPGGKVMRLVWVWSGQSIEFGNTMTVTVKLKSELDGLVNANIRNYGQAYDPNKPAPGLDILNKHIEDFDVKKPDILKFTDKSKKSLQTSTYNNQYGSDSTFAGAVNNLLRQNGDTGFANNIGEPNIAVYSPLTWKADEEVIANGATDIPPGKGPDPTTRYAYLLGPSVISTVRRDYNWKPPQQTNLNTPSTQTLAQPRDPVTGQFQTKNPPSQPQNQTKKSTKATSATQGTANARANPGVSNASNPDGPTKQILQNQEMSSTMSFQTNLTPVLVGIKPYDMLYIPSFKGDYIEDWVVRSVSYDQNDGRITVGVNATRVYGQGTPMCKPMADKYLEYAKQQKLVGPGATLDAWDQYAWTLAGNASAAAPPATFSQNAPVSVASDSLNLPGLSGKGALR